jgi:hypothetical protein
MLDYKSNDGIYTTTINGVNYIGINASAIKTGAITVGNKFYADIFNDKVEIAGWTIDSNKITKGTLSQENSFCMYSSDFGSGAYFGADSPKDWALGIGSYFGVTNTGELYAKGYIKADGGNIG